MLIYCWTKIQFSVVKYKKAHNRSLLLIDKEISRASSPLHGFPILLLPLLLERTWRTSEVAVDQTKRYQASKCTVENENSQSDRGVATNNFEYTVEGEMKFPKELHTERRELYSSSLTSWAGNQIFKLQRASPVDCVIFQWSDPVFWCHCCND